jgi:hypothetical protein
MYRAARKAVFISDANNFGQGRLPSRMLKQGLNALAACRTDVCDLIGNDGFAGANVHRTRAERVISVASDQFGRLGSCLTARGLVKVRGEWSLVTMAWNMKRMFVLNPA